jgi:hypothetical protein
MSDFHRIKRRRLLAEGSGSIFTNTEAEANYNAAVLLGGEWDDTEKAAVDAFVTAAKAASIFSLIRRANLMVGTFPGIAAPLVTTIGDAADTLNNYVEGDWDRASGLQGDGSSTYIDTGYVPSEATGFLGVCSRGTALSATAYWAGCGGGGQEYAVGHSSAGSGQPRAYWGGSTIANVTTAAPSAAGIWAANRVNSTSLELLKDNTILASSATSTTPASGVNSLVFGAINFGTKSSYLGVGQRLAGYIVLSGLDSTQRAALQSAWATFNTAIGR